MKKYGRIREPTAKPTQAVILDGGYRVWWEKTNGHWRVGAERVKFENGQAMPALLPVEMLVVDFSPEQCLP